MAERLSRPNFYDFQKVSIDDLKSEQSFQLNNTAAVVSAVAGSGVLLDFPTEPIIFDSDSLDSFQSGLVAINTFDGQGILSTPYTSTDLTGGNQLSVEITDARLDGFINTSVFILGKTFDHKLTYEVLEFGSNTSLVTDNHFIEVTNLLFQNFRGNLNFAVDGYGCYNVGGRLTVKEASSMRVTRDVILDEQTKEPSIPFGNFKTASSGTTLQVTLQNAIGPTNDVDDLNVNTSTAKTRTFAAGDTSEIIYAQKFKMNSNNIQKVSLLLSLASGATWSGTLVVGIRALQTSVINASDFLPDDAIGFDPSTESLDEIAFNQSDLTNRGIVLGTNPQVVDFVFNGFTISNPNLSTLTEDNFYVVTIRRTGSTATGTIVIPEAGNDDPENRRLSVFSNSVWTDVKDSTMWYRVWSDAVKVASGICYDVGIRLVSPKTEIDENGVRVQTLTADYDFANTGESVENYVIVQKSTNFTTPEAHPRTGDKVFAQAEDAPLFSVLEQADVFSLIEAGEEPVVLGRVRDLNPKSNPTITGTIGLPGLVIGNIVTIISPGSDLLTQNVVGSIITPNTSKPNLTYRVIKQTVFEDNYGDTNLDGIIDVADAARIAELDGYATDLNSGTVDPSIQLAAVLGGDVSVAELLRADVAADGVIDSTDLADINAFLTDGTALPAGSSFVRIELAVEPLFDQFVFLDADANSTLHLETLDTSFINNTSFSALTFSIAPMAVWEAENIKVVDLRRFITTTFIDFNEADLQASPENGGVNSLFIPGDLYLTGTVNNLDGSGHPLDYEKVVIEIDLPEGDTVGEVNIFDSYVLGKMKFSNGELVSNTALNDNQVRFELSISSVAKNVVDGDGYDYVDGYEDNVDFVLGTYLDHDTGLLRLNCKGIVFHSLFPQIRTRITIAVELKRAGFINSMVSVNPTALGMILS